MATRHLFCKWKVGIFPPRHRHEFIFAHHARWTRHSEHSTHHQSQLPDAFQIFPSQFYFIYFILFYLTTIFNSFACFLFSSWTIKNVAWSVGGIWLQFKLEFSFFLFFYFVISYVVESFSQPIKDIVYKWRGSEPGQVNRDAVGFSVEATSMLHFAINGYRSIEANSSRVDEDNRLHSRLLFEIYLERSLGYYIIQIYVPSSLIVVISWISFWIPRNSAPARVTLGVTTVLTMVTFTSIGANAGLPNISYLKALDIYLAISFMMVFMALIEYALVSYAEKQAKKTAAQMTRPSLADMHRAIRRRKATAAKRMTSMMGTASQSSFVATIEASMAATAAAAADASPPPPMLRQRRQSVSIHVNNEEMTCRFDISTALPSRIEWFSRFFFPLAFLAFNLVYWWYYWFKHPADQNTEFGYVNYKSGDTWRQQSINQSINQSKGAINYSLYFETLFLLYLFLFLSFFLSL